MTGELSWQLSTLAAGSIFPRHIAVSGIMGHKISRRFKARAKRFGGFIPDNTAESGFPALIRFYQEILC